MRRQRLQLWKATFRSPGGRTFVRLLYLTRRQVRAPGGAAAAAWADRRERGKPCDGWALAEVRLAGLVVGQRLVNGERRYQVIAPPSRWEIDW